jgi:hypothetical protein
MTQPSTSVPSSPGQPAGPSLEELGAPPATAATLHRLRDDLARAAGTNLAGLILYGGLARGRYHPGKSDINVVVLLRDASAASLAAIAPALQAAWRAVRVEPFLLTPGEIPHAAQVFPTKFLDIQARHVVLVGDDPFTHLTVAREPIRYRIEQTLRNLELRLRRRYIAIAGDVNALAMALAQITRPLALELAALLRLTGKQTPAEDRSALILEAAATAFGLDREALAGLAALRRDPRAVPDPAALYGRVLETLARAAELAHQLKESPT